MSNERIAFNIYHIKSKEELKQAMSLAVTNDVTHGARSIKDKLEPKSDFFRDSNEKLAETILLPPAIIFFLDVEDLKKKEGGRYGNDRE